MSAPYYQDDSVTLHHGDALEVARGMESGSVDCIVTSPPYFGLRDYGVDGQYGLEESPAEYVETMRALFTELRRILADDGTLWINLGDSYSSRVAVRPSSHQDGLQPDREELRKDWRRDKARGLTRMPKDNGLPEKNLMGIPWRVAFALQDDGWILRNDIIWAKASGMPESVRDRLSKRHEYVFLLTKTTPYHFDLDAIRVEAITTRESALTWDRPQPDIPGQKPQKRPGRPQRLRAEELAREKGLTQEHLDAIRSAGVTDTGKAVVLQSGAGKNSDRVQRLAAEAKDALGGYYREFLTSSGKNPGDVWTIATQPFPGAHFATMPLILAEQCVLAGCKPGGTVLDPFSGSGTTGLAAQRTGRRYIGIDINAEYLDLSLRTRLHDATLDFGLS